MLIPRLRNPDKRLIDIRIVPLIHIYTYSHHEMKTGGVLVECCSPFGYYFCHSPASAIQEAMEVCNITTELSPIYFIINRRRTSFSLA